MIIINSEGCKGCGLCVSVCKKEALALGKSMNKKGYYYVSADQSKCVGCGMCYRMCPDCCIELRD
jgi:2-oxoglutarate ferredoxin oxidoreductase subunit delta